MATRTHGRNHGVNLSYNKTRDILTVAFLKQFPERSYGAEHAEQLARELAEEILRPALSATARKRLDAMKRNGNGKVPAA